MKIDYRVKTQRTEMINLKHLAIPFVIMKQFFPAIFLICWWGTTKKTVINNSKPLTFKLLLHEVCKVMPLIISSCEFEKT